MIRAGWSPSIRLFEAAACGTPIISDWWTGLDHFFLPGEEILIADSTQDILNHLIRISSDELLAISQAARKKALSSHTGLIRSQELEEYMSELLK